MLGSLGQRWAQLLPGVYGGQDLCDHSVGSDEKSGWKMPPKGSMYIFGIYMGLKMIPIPYGEMGKSNA